MKSKTVIKSNMSAINDLLMRNGKTVKDLSLYLGITRSAIYSLITRNKTDTETVVKLCNFFDCEVSAFFEYQTKEESDPYTQDPFYKYTPKTDVDYQKLYIELLEQNYALIREHLYEVKRGIDTQISTEE